MGVEETSGSGSEVGREGLGHVFGGSCFSGRLPQYGMREGAYLPKRLSPSFSPLVTLYTEGWDSLLNICRTLSGRNGGV